MTKASSVSIPPTGSSSRFLGLMSRYALACLGVSTIVHLVSLCGLISKFEIMVGCFSVISPAFITAVFINNKLTSEIGFLRASKVPYASSPLWARHLSYILMAYIAGLMLLHFLTEPPEHSPSLAVWTPRAASSMMSAASIYVALHSWRLISWRCGQAGRVQK